MLFDVSEENCCEALHALGLPIFRPVARKSDRLLVRLPLTQSRTQVRV